MDANLSLRLHPGVRRAGMPDLRHGAGTIFRAWWSIPLGIVARMWGKVPRSASCEWQGTRAATSWIREGNPEHGTARKGGRNPESAKNQ